MRELVAQHLERHAVLKSQRDRRGQRVHQTRDGGPLFAHGDEHFAGHAVIVEADGDVALVTRDGELVSDRHPLVREPPAGRLGVLGLDLDLGLLVAGGISRLKVFKKPKIGLLAIGSELLLPGANFSKGKLYASNVGVQNAWCKSLGFETDVQIAGDTPSEISARVKKMLENADIIITSGGAWKGDRDFVIRVLADLGWKFLFHRVRIRPGKAVGMGTVDRKPVFCLSGGPASNEIAFIMIALPAIHQMTGAKSSPYLHLNVKLEKSVRGVLDWTQFLHCRVIQSDSETLLRPIKLKSRLSSIAESQAIIQIPEGTEEIPAGSVVSSICLDRNTFSIARRF